MTDRPARDELDATPWCCNGNAEDCALCTDPNPPYPFLCPGHPLSASNQRLVGEAVQEAELDTCRPVEVDGETVRVRGAGELTEEGQEAVAALVRVAKAKFVAEAPEQVGVLQTRLRAAHKARRVKERQLDDIRRALCDAGFMEDDDPYSHADLADVIRQAVEPDQPGTVRGPIPAEYVRLKGQLESELRKMTACAAQDPRPGAEEGRAAQGGIAAGIRSSLAWAIQHFEGSAAREAFLKRLEGDR